MSQWIERLRNRSAAFIHDLLMIPLAWLGAYWLRFNLESPPAAYLETSIMALLAVIPLQGLVFWLFGLYRGVWRFASLPDLLRILKAVAIGTLLCVGALFVIWRLEDVPRSVPVLFALLQLLLLAGPRLLYRWSRDRHLTLGEGRRVLIVGAGSAGEMLVRDMLRDRRGAYLPVGFVDDLVRRQGSDVHGVPVCGSCERIPELVQQFDIEVVVLAIPSANSLQMRRLVDLCEAAAVPFRTVPKLHNLMAGQVTVDQLRTVSIEDLLGRDPVTLDWKGIRAGLTGRTILVTGGGGSIGSELCRQIARLGPARLVVFEQSEFNLYRVELELRHHYPGLDLVPRLGDVSDGAAVAQLFARWRPEVVFHTAAYKHVPMLEDQVREAVRVNVLGTRRVADAALANGCQELVLISTDKAVHPANVMGATKRLAERYCQSFDGACPTRFITVRFGNVLDSAGSVVPLFRGQIEQGGPVTLTHPDMERYFMTIPEACQLIMQAGVLGRGGEILVLDMGQPVKIRYLAEQMIRLAGWEIGAIPIICIGLRPGEKLQEELFYKDEDLAPTAHTRIQVAHHRPLEVAGLNAAWDELERAVTAYDRAALVGVLRRLVPEWTVPKI